MENTEIIKRLADDFSAAIVSDMKNGRAFCISGIELYDSNFRRAFDIAELMKSYVKELDENRTFQGAVVP